MDAANRLFQRFAYNFLVNSQISIHFCKYIGIDNQNKTPLTLLQNI